MLYQLQWIGYKYQKFQTGSPTIYAQRERERERERDEGRGVERRRKEGFERQQIRTPSLSTLIFSFPTQVGGTSDSGRNIRHVNSFGDSEPEESSEEGKAESSKPKKRKKKKKKHEKKKNKKQKTMEDHGSAVMKKPKKTKSKL
nr:protein PXR1-like isoform X4 [Ziziphus jujuba var. spinosa]